MLLNLATTVTFATYEIRGGTVCAIDALREAAYWRNVARQRAADIRWSRAHRAKPTEQLGLFASFTRGPLFVGGSIPARHEPPVPTWHQQELERAIANARSAILDARIHRRNEWIPDNTPWTLPDEEVDTDEAKAARAVARRMARRMCS